MTTSYDFLSELAFSVVPHSLIPSQRILWLLVLFPLFSFQVWTISADCQTSFLSLCGSFTKHENGLNWPLGLWLLLSHLRFLTFSCCYRGLLSQMSCPSVPRGALSTSSNLQKLPPLDHLGCGTLGPYSLLMHEMQRMQSEGGRGKKEIRMKRTMKNCIGLFSPSISIAKICLAGESRSGYGMRNWI